MKITAIHKNFTMPTRADDGSSAFDIYMPEPGQVAYAPQKVGLGFASAIPHGWCALILPRSSTGTRYGLELNNSVGLIDSSYRGEWFATLRTKSGSLFTWNADTRVLQFLLVPHYVGELHLVETLDETSRGSGGHGSSGI